jgi:dTDP-glucose 4,6-dehydratase
MERLLITGGAGFIGSNLVHFLDKKLNSKSMAAEFVVLDSLTYAGNINNLSELVYRSKVSLIEGDVRDLKTVSNLVESVDGVFHLAAESHVDRSISNPSIFVDTNVLGTFNLLEAATKHQKRIIIVSTDEVYGSLSDEYATEESRLNPSSPYSASKAAGDLMSLAYWKTFGTNVTVTRCSNNYGVRQYPEKLIPLAINRLAKGQRVPIYGNGLNIRDWIHVEDHCAGLWKAFKNGEPGEVYNFGGVDHLTNIEVIQSILNSMNMDTSHLEFVKDRPGHDFRYAVNANKAKQYLGWEPRYSFANTVQDTVDWYLSKIN